MSSRSTSRPSSSPDFRPPFDLRLLYVSSPPNGPLLIACDLPGHQDDTPSLAVYADHTYCFGCRRSESWRQHCRRRGWSSRLPPDDPPFGHLVAHAVRGTRAVRAEGLSEEEVRALAVYYHQRLRAEDAADWLRQRGLSDETIDRYLLGYSGRAYSIPIWEGEHLHTIRFRLAREPGPNEPKYWGLAGRNGAYLFAPLGVGERVVVCEGEFDCLLAVQLGYCAVTVTNGIGQLSGLAERLASCQEVVVAADQDGPGYAGALALSAELRRRGVRARIAHWAAKDLTDLYLARGPHAVHRALGGVDAPARDHS